ncbi:MAG: hypothetical protein ACM3NQ_23115 [Bacteroidales bacterium]
MKSTLDATISVSRAPVASVRLSWADCNVAHVPAVHLCDLHWDEMPGHRTSETVLCGFTSSDAVIAGDLVASPAGRPRNIRVCILPEDNDRAVFARLALEAGPRPRRTHLAA